MSHMRIYTQIHIVFIQVEVVTVRIIVVIGIVVPCTAPVLTLPRKGTSNAHYPQLHPLVITF